MPARSPGHRLAANDVQTVNFGSAAIHFTVEYRRRKHIGITVRPDLSVLVAAPEGTPLDEVRVRVQRRGPWILRQLDRFQQFRPAPTPRQFLNGETHRYLGRQYRLKIVQGEELGGGWWVARTSGGPLPERRDASRCSKAGRILRHRPAGPTTPCRGVVPPPRVGRRSSGVVSGDRPATGEGVLGWPLEKLVTRMGLEPMTTGLKVRCSTS
jgi:hypothetical protein